METFLAMSRGDHSFKQGDVAKLVRGAIRGGMTVARVEYVYVDGTLSVSGTLGPKDETDEGDSNEWDDVK
jgi:hypothetical protein